MDDVRIMQHEVWKIAEEHGFHDANSNAERLLLIAGEVGEAISAWQRSGKVDASVAEELTDVVIRIMDLMYHCNWDLETALSVKIEYNKTRPHMHGKAH